MKLGVEISDFIGSRRLRVLGLGPFRALEGLGWLRAEGEGPWGLGV